MKGSRHNSCRYEKHRYSDLGRRLQHGGHRQSAFRFFFFSREEPRMHVHVAHTDGEAKFWLEPKIELAMNQGLSKQQLHDVLLLAQDHYEEITNAWHSYF